MAYGVINASRHDLPTDRRTPPARQCARHLVFEAYLHGDPNRPQRHSTSNHRHGMPAAGADDLTSIGNWSAKADRRSPKSPPTGSISQLYYHPDKGVRGKTYSKLAALLPKGRIDFDALSDCRGAAAFGRPDASDDDRRGGRRAAPRRARSLQLCRSRIRPFSSVTPLAASQLRDLTYASLLDEALGMLDNVDGLKDLRPRERQALVAECRAQILGELGVTPLDGRNLSLQHGGRHGGQGLWLDRAVAGPEFGLRLVAARHVDGCSRACSRAGSTWSLPAALRTAPPIRWSCFPPPRR